MCTFNQQKKLYNYLTFNESSYNIYMECNMKILTSIKIKQLLWDMVVENSTYKQLINDLALMDYSLTKLNISVGNVTNLYDVASVVVRDDNDGKFYKVEI